MPYLMVFIGGGAGSLLRFFFVRCMGNIPAPFPVGVLFVNIIGSIAIGVLAGLGFKNHEIINPLLVVGFLGGFTTFSAFSLEAVTILQQGRFAHAAIYIGSSILFCIAGTFIGLKLT